MNGASSSSSSTSHGDSTMTIKATVPLPSAVNTDSTTKIGAIVSSAAAEPLQVMPTTLDACTRGEQTPCAAPVHEEKAAGDAQCGGGSRSGPPTPSGGTPTRHHPDKRPPPLIVEHGGQASARHTDPINKRLLSPSHKAPSSEGSPHSQSPGPPFNHVYCMIDPQDMNDSSPLFPAKNSPKPTLTPKPATLSVRTKTGNSLSQGSPLSQ